MATVTSNSNMGHGEDRSANTPIYWGVAIVAAVIIAFALFMRPEKVSSTASAVDNTATAQTMDTTPKTNTLASDQTDPATGALISDSTSRANSRVRGMDTDPRNEQLYNGANSTNGGISPNSQQNQQNQDSGK